MDYMKQDNSLIVSESGLLKRSKKKEDRNIE